MNIILTLKVELNCYNVLYLVKRMLSRYYYNEYSESKFFVDFENPFICWTGGFESP